MQRNITIFFLVLAAVAITGQLVRNNSQQSGYATSNLIGTTFGGIASVFGTVTTGDPRFYNSSNSTTHQ